MHLAELSSFYAEYNLEKILFGIDKREENPEWILCQIYQQYGYSLKFSPYPDHNPTVLTEEVDVICENPTQRAALNIRFGILSYLPEMRLLMLAYDPPARGFNSFEIIENIVNGNVLDTKVQEDIPGAQNIDLDNHDLRQILALAYHQEYLYMEDSINHIRRESTKFRHVGRWIGDETASKEIISKLQPKIQEARDRRDGLDAVPISPGRMRVILEGLTKRVEHFLTGSLPTPGVK